MDFLTKKVAASDHPVIVSLCLDEMKIHEHIEFDGQEFRGGTGKNLQTYNLIMKIFCIQVNNQFFSEEHTVSYSSNFPS